MCKRKSIFENVHAQLSTAGEQLWQQQIHFVRKRFLKITGHPNLHQLSIVKIRIKDPLSQVIGRAALMKDFLKDTLLK